MTANRRPTDLGLVRAERLGRMAVSLGLRVPDMTDADVARPLFAEASVLRVAYLVGVAQAQRLARGWGEA